MNVAFGITYFDSNPYMIIEPDYGEVVARVKSWDSGGLYWQNLNLRPCTREDLGMDSEGIQPSAKFYPPHKNSKDYLDFYWQKLYCYDDYVKVYGNYNTGVASALQISFVKCDNELRDTCKSEEEITEFTRRLFLVYHHNCKMFDQLGYDDLTISYESKFIWSPFRSTERSEQIYEMKNTNLRLQDSQFF